MSPAAEHHWTQRSVAAVERPKTSTVTLLLLLPLKLIRPIGAIMRAGRSYSLRTHEPCLALQRQTVHPVED